MTQLTLASLAIQTEAWLQEELGAQQACLAALARIESAARTGTGAELVSSGRELEELLATAGARETRRAALLARLAPALGVPAGRVALSDVCARLAGEGIDTTRLERMRVELREVARAVQRSGRRLAALARYHRGFFEELCQLLGGGSASSAGCLVDARA